MFIINNQITMFKSLKRILRGGGGVKNIGHVIARSKALRSPARMAIHRRKHGSY